MLLRALLFVCAGNGEIPPLIAAVVHVHIGKAHVLHQPCDLNALVLKRTAALDFVDRGVFH